MAINLGDFVAEVARIRRSWVKQVTRQSFGPSRFSKKTAYSGRVVSNKRLPTNFATGSNSVPCSCILQAGKECDHHPETKMSALKKGRERPALPGKKQPRHPSGKPDAPTAFGQKNVNTSCRSERQ